MSSRFERRGMTLTELRRQNCWPRPELEARALLPSDALLPPQDGTLLHPDDIRLIARLNAASGGQGVSRLALARLYFPDAVSDHGAVTQLTAEMSRCRGLPQALAALHYRPQAHRFTCLQTEQIFLLFGSPPLAD